MVETSCVCFCSDQVWSRSPFRQRGKRLRVRGRGQWNHQNHVPSSVLPCFESAACCLYVNRLLQQGAAAASFMSSVLILSLWYVWTLFLMICFQFGLIRMKRKWARRKRRRRRKLIPTETKWLRTTPRTSSSTSFVLHCHTYYILALRKHESSAGIMKLKQCQAGAKALQLFSSSAHVQVGQTRRGWWVQRPHWADQLPVVLRCGARRHREGGEAVVSADQRHAQTVPGKHARIKPPPTFEMLRTNPLFSLPRPISEIYWVSIHHKSAINFQKTAKQPKHCVPLNPD